HGGITFAQTPKSAKFDGMPRAAIGTGNIDFVLSPEKIAAELWKIAQHPYLISEQAPEDAGQPAERHRSEEALQVIFSQLLRVSQVDFSRYKLTTIKRRIARRMAVLKLPSLPVYAEHLKKHREEVEALFNDLLINVTKFFRDSDSFEALKAEIFPSLLANRTKGTPIRIWIPGCSTGEEVYSMAMALIEFLDDKASAYPVQIFATDISERALALARSGIYPETISQEVSKERLQRFFHSTADGRYRVQKFIRDICLFSRHDVTNDPPFARIDLISCRNLLIYFDASLQKKVVSLFHYSLNPGGALWLGRSESVEHFRNYFREADKTHKVFFKKAGTVPPRFRLSGAFSPERLVAPVAPVALPATGTTDALKDADRIVLTKYGPPGITVNAESEIVQFRGRTAPFLEPIPGHANLTLVKMMRPELLRPVKELLAEAKARNRPIRLADVSFKENGRERRLNLEVIPVNPDSPQKDRYYLVLFEPFLSRPSENRPRSKDLSASDRRAENRAVAQLQRELDSSREHVQVVTEKYETSQEELTSSNEELQSTNEELQSTNEELETAKEELQSTNEELTTVNEELQNRNLELTNANNDLLNVLSSVEIPILIVGNDRRIRRFTPKAGQLLNMIPSDVGRPVGDIKPNLEISDLEGLISHVIETMVVHDSEIKSRDNVWYRLQIRPYRTVDNKIDGIVLSLMDIDIMKRRMDEVRMAERQYRALLESAHDPIIIVNENGDIEFTNSPVERQFGYRPAELAGKTIEILLPERFRKQHIAQRKAYMRDPKPRMMGAGLDLFGLRKDGTEFPVDVALSGVQLEKGLLVTAVVRDITEQKKREEERALLLIREREARTEAEGANKAKDEFLATLSHELRTPMTTILSWTQLLQTVKMDEQRAQKALETIELNAKAQSQLIDDLLDVSRIIAGKLTLALRNVDPAEIVRAASEMVKPQAEKKAIQLNLTVNPIAGTVHVDPMRLQQILWNILTNAVKFTPEKGRISVSLEQEGDSVLIRVTDTGKGIPAQFLLKIFDRFQQADSSITRVYGGLGLGLSLVRRLTEAQGGSVRAESLGEGKGATFTLRLPLQIGISPSPCPDSKRPQAFGVIENSNGRAPSALQGIRILLVDDETSTTEAISALLSEYGAKVETAKSAAEAMIVLKKSRPDIIVSDIAMPGEDGYTLLRKIRAMEKGKARPLPAIAMTAFAGEDDRQRAMEAGFSAHVSKPVDLAYLSSVIAHVIRDRD
ncbi:MAG: CheR family methyltransferase, partial [Bdellovibrionota bacterium]